MRGIRRAGLLNDRKEKGVEPRNTIAEMDLSNLTDEQVEVLTKLARFAEDGFDLSAERTPNHKMRVFREKQAGQCMVLRHRLRQEKENRSELWNPVRDADRINIDGLIRF